jgi:hypothetical protein
VRSKEELDADVANKSAAPQSWTRHFKLSVEKTR